MKLILGAGGTDRELGATHVDIMPVEGIDIVHDLNVYPWPILSNMYDDILANDIIEHLDKVIPFIEECHRVAKPNAFLEIRTCQWGKGQSYTDPTHRHWFNLESFDFFVPNTRWSDKYHWYSKCRMEKVMASEIYDSELKFVFRIIK